MTDSTTPTREPKAFPATRWSVVLAARQVEGDRAGAALDEICRSYWYPLYAYVRRCGHSPEDAQDLTQEFFARLLEKRWLEAADREKGKLRTFLIVALKKFMAKEWRRVSAQKRGGGAVHVEFDTAVAESRYVAESSSGDAEEVYEQQWALTILDLTVEKLRKELTAAGRPRDFEFLKECLVAARGEIDYEVLAKNLGINEGAARVAVHRLRKRFREIYREEIAQTLAQTNDLDGELRHLAQAVIGNG